MENTTNIANLQLILYSTQKIQHAIYLGMFSKGRRKVRLEVIVIHENYILSSFRPILDVHIQGIRVRRLYLNNCDCTYIVFVQRLHKITH